MNKEVEEKILPRTLACSTL